MKNPFTQKEYEDFLKGKFSSDLKWARHALLLVYNSQSQDEKRGLTSINQDGKGFTGYDSNILSTIARRVINKIKINDYQVKVLFEKMPKYWKQVLAKSDMEKLHTAMSDGRQLNIFKDKG